MRIAIRVQGYLVRALAVNDLRADLHKEKPPDVGRDLWMVKSIGCGRISFSGVGKMPGWIFLVGDKCMRKILERAPDDLAAEQAVMRQPQDQCQKTNEHRNAVKHQAMIQVCTPI